MYPRIMWAKSGIMLKGDVSGIWLFHPLAKTMVGGCHNTFPNNCGSERKLSCCNNIAEFHSDRNEVEDRACANHRDTWNRHVGKF
jgi:hypothetical protein